MAVAEEEVTVHPDSILSAAARRQSLQPGVDSVPEGLRKCLHAYAELVAAHHAVLRAKPAEIPSEAGAAGGLRLFAAKKKEVAVAVDGGGNIEQGHQGGGCATNGYPLADDGPIEPLARAQAHGVAGEVQRLERGEAGDGQRDGADQRVVRQDERHQAFEVSQLVWQRAREVGAREGSATTDRYQTSARTTHRPDR